MRDPKLTYIQYMYHFRDNELGCDQTAPYNDCGLTPFGHEVVRECNRLGIIIDLAHANTRTTMDVVAVSRHPVIFSHTGVKALYEGDRYLTDEEIRAIASNGGIIGIWPAASFIMFISSAPFVISEYSQNPSCWPKSISFLSLFRSIPPFP